MIESNLNHLLANERRKKAQLAKESRQAGIIEGKLVAARQLLDLLSDEIIAEKLELPLATVQKLRQE